MTATNQELLNPDYAGHTRVGSEEQPRSTRHSPAPGIGHFGLNRRAVSSGTRFREVPAFESNPSLLPPERTCEEKGMLSATQTHLAKELFHDTTSTTHDRGHAGEEFLTAYPKLLRATGLAVRTPFQANTHFGRLRDHRHVRHRWTREMQRTRGSALRCVSHCR